MNILFMGTPEFSVPGLKVLINSKHNVCGVVTQPDKPKGRGHKLAPPPVKVCALAHNIPVFQPSTLKNESFLSEIKSLDPDLIIVIAYGKILPKYILDYPKFGCINVHASLLPKYRGAAPIQWAVINGEKETGVTTMFMSEGLDTGDMLIKKPLSIGDTETAGELHDRLMQIGAEALKETIEAIENNTLIRYKQDDSQSNYASMLSKETGHIDWHNSSNSILNLIRGTNPWPISFSNYKNEILKIYKAEKGFKTDKKPGQIIGLTDKKLEVAAGDGKSVLVSEIQFVGGKQMSIECYLNGHNIDFNEVLV